MLQVVYLCSLLIHTLHQCAHLHLEYLKYEYIRWVQHLRLHPLLHLVLHSAHLCIVSMLHSAHLQSSTVQRQAAEHAHLALNLLMQLVIEGADL